MVRHERRAAVVVAAAAVVLAACSGGGGAKVGSGATTTQGPAATAAGGGSVPSVATTAIPGAPPPSAPVAGGTSAPVPTTTIPLTPPSGGAPDASSPAVTTPAAPDTTAGPGQPGPAPSTPSPAPTAATGDPTGFCRAVGGVLPLYLTTLILVDSADSTADGTKFEVAVAPALAGPVHAAATSAPAAVAGPFQRWAARTDDALAALRGAGASDAQVSGLGTAYSARVDQATSGGETQSPPDPVEAAAHAGIDVNRLGAAASAFASTDGDFDTFAGSLGQDLNLAPSQLNDLAAQYPCVADLASFSG